jgi:hypothetical protein
LTEEHCCNPLKLKCENKDILLYIQIGSKKTPICKQCWNTLADSRMEWGEEGLKNEEEIQ